MKKLLCAFAIVGFISACSPAAKTGTDEQPNREPSSNTSEPAVPLQPGPVTIQRLDESLDSYYRYSSSHEDSARLVIHDKAAWEDLWARMTSNHGPRRPAPAVDFSREMLIAVAMGTRSSGGFGIRVTEVNASSAELTATVVSTSPGPTCGTTAALTAPMDVVRVPRSSLPVRFVERSAVTNCG